jgi:Holliday junction resolvase
MVQISISGKMQRKEVWKGKQAKQEEGLAQATRTNGPAVIRIPTSRHRKTPPLSLLVVRVCQRV